MKDGFTAEAANWEGIFPGYYVKQYVNGKVVIEQFLTADSKEELEAAFPGEQIEFI